MEFEDILEEVGSFGLYQKILCFLFIPLTTGICGLVYYIQLFILLAPQHICKHDLSGNDTNFLSFQDVKLWSVALQNSTGRENLLERLSSCLQYVDRSSVNEDNWILNVTSVKSTVQEEHDKRCSNGWIYDYDGLFPTISSENNWVCEEAWRPYFIITLFWVGNTIGAWLFGALSDIIGRRPVVGMALFVYGTAGVASAFLTDFYGFVTLRFFVGFSHHTVSHLVFVLVVEYCGIKSRVVPLLTIMMSYTLSSIVSPLLAQLLWNWQTLMLSSSIPALLVLLLYKWIPESPSWLVSKRKFDPAARQLHVVATINGEGKSETYLAEKLKTFAESATEAKDGSSKDENIKKESFKNVLKYYHLRNNIFKVLAVWMIGCMCYYGHCQNTSNLGSDILKSYFFGAIVEIPSWCTPFLIHKLGRRITLLGAFLISGLAAIAYAAVPKDLYLVAFCFALAGRMFITGAYYVTLQYGPEIFPTVIRGRGVSLSETFGGVATFVSPLVVYTVKYSTTLPLVIFGCLAVVGGMITLYLPETKGVALPQTLEQADNFARNASPICSCIIKQDEDIIQEQSMQTRDTLQSSLTTP